MDEFNKKIYDELFRSGSAEEKLQKLKNPDVLITPEVFEELMLQIKGILDFEERHTAADNLMCMILTESGYSKGVKIYEEMEKWYA